jgi:hypothetical protein
MADAPTAPGRAGKIARLAGVGLLGSGLATGISALVDQDRSPLETALIAATGLLGAAGHNRLVNRSMGPEQRAMLRRLYPEMNDAAFERLTGMGSAAVGTGLAGLAHAGYGAGQLLTGAMSNNASTAAMSGSPAVEAQRVAAEEMVG